MILGSLFTYTQAPIVWIVVMLLNIFGGAWVDLREIGGGNQSVMNYLPFVYDLVLVSVPLLLISTGFLAIPWCFCSGCFPVQTKDGGMN
jgi:hypothetical protein